MGPRHASGSRSQGGLHSPALLDRLSRLKSDRRWIRRRLLILGGEGSERSREAETREPQRPRFSVERPEHSIGSHGRDWRSLPPGVFLTVAGHASTALAPGVGMPAEPFPNRRLTMVRWLIDGNGNGGDPHARRISVFFPAAAALGYVPMPLSVLWQSCILACTV